MILIGIDDTIPNRSAVRWAAGRAAVTGEELQLLHIVDDEWGVAGERDLAELHPDARRIESSAIELATTAAPGVRVTGRIAVGDPMVELRDRSRESTMVVVGTHKTGYIRGRAIGSRSLQLSAMAWCPVAVIPNSPSTSRTGIVVGLDDSDAGRAAVTFAGQEASRTGGPLLLVHAGAGRAIGTTGTEALESDAVSTLRAGGYDGLVTMRSLAREPAGALLDAAASAELLVIGSSRRRGSQISALGPISHDVLLNITAPTVVVHGDMARLTTTSADSRENAS